MSVLGRQVPGWVVAALSALMILAVMIPALSSSAPSREIRLVAKDMAFYLENDLRTPNPTITVRAGERVRLTLRNDDRGMTHDFALAAADAALDPISWNQSAAVTFGAPAQAGTYEYVCRPHQLIMRGAIRVV